MQVDAGGDPAPGLVRAALLLTATSAVRSASAAGVEIVSGGSHPFLTSLRSSHVPSNVAIGAASTITTSFLDPELLVIVGVSGLILGNEVIEVVDLVGEVPLPNIILGDS